MKILFIGARLFNEVAYYAKSKGIETILTESNKESVNLKLADEYHIVPRGMEQPIELAISKDVDAVVPLIGIDKPLIDVALMKEKLEKEYKLPVIASPKSAAEIAGDKFQTKKFLKTNNIKTPNYSKLNKDKPFGSLQYPVVLKQSEGQGGVGVKISCSTEETQDYFNTFSNSMAEEYVEGAEISVEVLRWKNKSVPLVGVYKGDTTISGTHPIKKTRKAPLNLNGLDNRELLELAKKISDKLGTEGTAEVEFIYKHDVNELNTLEINTRPSGTRFLTYCATGISPVQQLVNMGMGEWSPKKIMMKIRNCCSLELPLPPHILTTNPDLRNDHNQERQILTKHKPYLIHGPDSSSRITFRSYHIDEPWKIMKNLNIRLR